MIRLITEIKKFWQGESVLMCWKKGFLKLMSGIFYWQICTLPPPVHPVNYKYVKYFSCNLGLTAPASCNTRKMVPRSNHFWTEWFTFKISQSTFFIYPTGPTPKAEILPIYQGGLKERVLLLRKPSMTGTRITLLCRGDAQPFEHIELEGYSGKKDHCH